MTHLLKLGPAPPYKAQTECGMTVPTLDIVTYRPTCVVCAHVEQLEEATLCQPQSAN